MHQLHYYNLVLRYPGLHQVISRCYIDDRIDELFDLLVGLETDDQPNGFYHA